MEGIVVLVHFEPARAFDQKDSVVNKKHFDEWEILVEDKIYIRQDVGGANFVTRTKVLTSWIKNGYE
jgi:hypothetical protein